MAFAPSSGPNGGLSIDLQNEIELAGLEPRQYVSLPPWLGSVRFEAGQLRTMEFWVGYDPLPDQPHHGEVWGNFSRSKQRQLLRSGQWFVEIPGVALSDA